MAVRSALGLALLAHGVAGARMLKNSQQAMAGVKVHNFRKDAADWIVVFREGASDADIKDFCQGKCDFHGHPDAQGVPFAKVHGLSELKQLVEEHPEKIEVVEPDEVDWAIETSEEMASASWGLDRVGVAQRSGAGRGVSIYVQDTGIRGSHDDFGGRVLPAIDLTSGSLVVCSDSSCAADRQGHGTHCAGTAGGRTYGVASEATLHAVKTLSDQGSGARSWQFAAIDWVTASGVKPSVISMSLGGSGADPGYTTSIGAASNAGITVVVAAGNSNGDACNFSPAFTPLAITVGSTDSLSRRSSFSNYGTCVQIWAPGSSIVSAGISSDTSSRSLSGTSMACPHVSGAAALVLERNPSFLAPKVLEELLNTARTDEISGLFGSDTNKELFVGEGGAPQPAPTPAPAPGSWSISGSGCTASGGCIQSRNHPGSYSNNDSCTINLHQVAVTVEAFNTEARYDFLTMGGTRYSGSSGPSSGTYSGSINWASDHSIVQSGWRLCGFN